MKLQQDLAAVSSKLQKEQLLKGIEFLEWKAFVYAYDPYYIYHMKFKDFDIDNLGKPTTKLFDILHSILNGQVRGNVAKRRIEAFAERNGDLIKLIVNKDMRCGVTATTFNKVHPNSIDQFKVQLAKEAPISSLKYPLLAQLKYDGVRIIVINTNGTVEFKTRNGKIVNLPKLREIISNIPAMNYIIDSEITYGLGMIDGRTGISGAINSAMHGGVVDETDMVLNCFDFMTLKQFKACKCDDMYLTRWSMLREMVEKANNMQLQLAVTNEVASQEGVDELYQAAIAVGYEGLILKQEDHLYTFKRTKDWVKLKETKTADLRCTGIMDGTGKYKSMIGSLVCRGVVEGKDVVVDVGSGLSDVDRSLNKSYYWQKTIELKYNSLIQNSKTKQWSLFLPRFVQVRFDK